MCLASISQFKLNQITSHMVQMCALEILPWSSLALELHLTLINLIWGLNLHP